MANSTLNPQYLLDPQSAYDSQQIEQQRQIANALLGQGLKEDGGTQMAGNIAIRKSPLEGLAKVFQTYVGKSSLDDAAQKSAALNSRYSQMLMQALGGGQPQASPQNAALANAIDGKGGVPGAAPGGVPQNGGGYSPALPTQQVQPGSQFDLQSLLRAQAIGAFGGEAGQKAYYDSMAPTNEIKNSQFAQQNPQSPLAAEQRVKGTQALSPNGNILPNGQMVFGASEGQIPVTLPNGQLVSMPIPGYAGNLANQKGAVTAAETNARAQNEVRQAFNTQTGQTEFVQGVPGQNSNVVPKDVQQERNLTSLKILRDELAKNPNQPELQREVARAEKRAGLAPGQQAPQSAMLAAPPAGFNEGQVNAQKEISQRHTSLMQMNQQAESVNALLDNVKRYANDAIVGPGSKTLNIANSVLATVGLPAAKDSATAIQLLDKNANQIITRLSNGGLSTDAARTLLHSAYPNSGMTREAINEAADNLKGSNEMVKAKTKLLTPLANARDPKSYSEKEVVFDQNANPTVFQYIRESNPAVRKRIIQNAVKQDPQFLNKLKNLDAIGVQ